MVLVAHGVLQDFPAYRTSLCLAIVHTFCVPHQSQFRWETCTIAFGYRTDVRRRQVGFLVVVEFDLFVVLLIAPGMIANERFRQVDLPMMREFMSRHQLATGLARKCGCLAMLLCHMPTEFRLSHEFLADFTRDLAMRFLVRCVHGHENLFAALRAHSFPRIGMHTNVMSLQRVASFESATLRCRTDGTTEWLLSIISQPEAGAVVRQVTEVIFFRDKLLVTRQTSCSRFVFPICFRRRGSSFLLLFLFPMSSDVSPILPRRERAIAGWAKLHKIMRRFDVLFHEIRIHRLPTDATLETILARWSGFQTGFPAILRQLFCRRFDVFTELDSVDEIGYIGLIIFVSVIGIIIVGFFDHLRVTGLQSVTKESHDRVMIRCLEVQAGEIVLEVLLHPRYVSIEIRVHFHLRV